MKKLSIISNFVYPARVLAGMKHLFCVRIFRISKVRYTKYGKMFFKTICQDEDTGEITLEYNNEKVGLEFNLQGKLKGFYSYQCKKNENYQHNADFSCIIRGLQKSAVKVANQNTKVSRYQMLSINYIESTTINFNFIYKKNGYKTGDYFIVSYSFTGELVYWKIVGQGIFDQIEFPPLSRRDLKNIFYSYIQEETCINIENIVQMKDYRIDMKDKMYGISWYIDIIKQGSIKSKIIFSPFSKINRLL